MDGERKPYLLRLRQFPTLHHHLGELILQGIVALAEVQRLQILWEGRRIELEPRVLLKSLTLHLLNHASKSSGGLVTSALETRNMRNKVSLVVRLNTLQIVHKASSRSRERTRATGFFQCVPHNLRHVLHSVLIAAEDLFHETQLTRAFRLSDKTLASSQIMHYCSPPQLATLDPTRE